MIDWVAVKKAADTFPYGITEYKPKDTLPAVMPFSGLDKAGNKTWENPTYPDQLTTPDSHHNWWGEREGARNLASVNIDAYLKRGVSPLVRDSYNPKGGMIHMSREALVRRANMLNRQRQIDARIRHFMKQRTNADYNMKQYFPWHKVEQYYID